MDNKLDKEIEFGELFGSYALSPPDVDMVDHWDVEVPADEFEGRLIELAGVTDKDLYPRAELEKHHFASRADGYRFDVKAQPKGQQSHSYRWVELQNVRGAIGWLYGKSDYIAFEYGDYWILVPTSRLQRLVETKLDTTPMEGRDWSGNPQPYKIHKRDGRDDQVMMVPVVDLCWIGTIIKKP